MFKLLLIIFLTFRTCACFITSAAVFQTEVMKTFSAGETVTLQCSISQNYENYYYWFKQSLGEAPTCILSVYGSEMITFTGDFKSDKRLSVKKKKEYFALIINDTRSSDTGIYYCGARDYDQITFSNGMFLNYKVSGESTIQQYIQQFLPKMDLATSNKHAFNPGDSVNLQCTILTKRCVGNHSVYWFRHGAGDSHPGVIYTHENKNDECMRNSSLDSHSCIYNLPKLKVTSSDDGMYYCAVAMCGEILFGKGSRLAIEAQNSLWSDLKVSALVASNILCLLIIAALLYKRKSKTKETLETSHLLHQMPSVVSADEGALSYAAVNFPERRKTERSTDTNVVYSTARLGK
ncbi:novel immune-type receptor 12 [Paramisgurnus dabryanus]|uniref:novel immune-type receptor 12 n=1 Tax=Paramisgurnus dabryanus TaxID=90735 RepID=UPI0031F3B7E0